MQKNKTSDDEFYLARLTITILSRNRGVCDEIVGTISYAANCVETQYSDLIMIVEDTTVVLDEAEVRAHLNELAIEVDEIGLAVSDT